MTGSGPVEDRLLIRERMSGYSDAVFQSDVEAYLACWQEAGVRVGNGTEVRGKAALRAQWLQRLRTQKQQASKLAPLPARSLPSF